MGTEKREKTKKIAVCSFRDRVCPRFDLTPEILIFDINDSQTKCVEKLDVCENSPEKIIQALSERKVDVLILGGIQERFQEMLLNHHIETISRVVGEVHDVVDTYLKGMLHPGKRVIAGPRKKVPFPIPYK